MVAGSASGGLVEPGVPGRCARDALWAATASKSMGSVLGGLLLYHGTACLTYGDLLLLARLTVADVWPEMLAMLAIICRGN